MWGAQANTTASYNALYHILYITPVIFYIITVQASSSHLSQTSVLSLFLVQNGKPLPSGNHSFHTESKNGSHVWIVLGHFIHSFSRNGCFERNNGSTELLLHYIFYIKKYWERWEDSKPSHRGWRNFQSSHLGAVISTDHFFKEFYSPKYSLDLFLSNVLLLSFRHSFNSFIRKNWQKSLQKNFDSSKLNDVQDC